VLISVHLPKTAGLSFRAALEEHYGERFAFDYGDYPLAHAPAERHRKALQAALESPVRDLGGIGCIHGHFLPVKYLLLADRLDCRFVTWMREPVARLVSHFHYWQRSYDPVSNLPSPLHRRVVEEHWSLEQFCQAPELRNVYTEFLWGFPLQRFDFIGITEHYEEDLPYFSTRFLGQPARVHALNQRGESVARSSACELPEALRRQVEEYHGADLALYRQALALRRTRLEGAG
jgi:hypothetical protein